MSWLKGSAAIITCHALKYIQFYFDFIAHKASRTRLDKLLAGLKWLAGRRVLMK